jgi:trehalose-6-phosphate synthase
MHQEERTARMQRLRKQVREQNIYRWAGSLIGELCGVRLDVSTRTQTAERATASALP